MKGFQVRLHTERVSSSVSVRLHTERVSSSVSSVSSSSGRPVGTYPLCGLNTSRCLRSPMNILRAKVPAGRTRETEVLTETEQPFIDLGGATHVATVKHKLAEVEVHRYVVRSLPPLSLSVLSPFSLPLAPPSIAMHSLFLPPPLSLSLSYPFP